MKQKKTAYLIATATLLGVSIVLDYVTSQTPGLNLSMPFGGKFFGISLLPILLIGIFYGFSYGLLASFIFAIYQFSMDYLIYLSTLLAMFDTWNTIDLILLFLLDYIIPFGALSLSGLFHKDHIKKIAFIFAILIPMGIRLISATLSGAILWGNYAKEAYQESLIDPSKASIVTEIFAFANQNIFIYSFIYNLIYIASTTALLVLITWFSHKRLLQLKMRYEG